jgi:hypothetical protein
MGTKHNRNLAESAGFLFFQKQGLLNTEGVNYQKSIFFGTKMLHSGI